MLSMPSEVQAEGSKPGIGKPGRQSEHLLFAAAVSVDQDRTSRRSRGSEEISRNLMSILRHEVIDLHQFSRHLRFSVPQMEV